MGAVTAPSTYPQAVRTEGYDVPRSRLTGPEVKARQQPNPDSTPTDAVLESMRNIHGGSMMTTENHPVSCEQEAALEKARKVAMHQMAHKLALRKLARKLAFMRNMGSEYKGPSRKALIRASRGWRRACIHNEKIQTERSGRQSRREADWIREGKDVICETWRHLRRQIENEKIKEKTFYRKAKDSARQRQKQKIQKLAASARSSTQTPAAQQQPDWGDASEPEKEVEEACTVEQEDKKEPPRPYQTPRGTRAGKAVQKRKAQALEAANANAPWMCRVDAVTHDSIPPWKRR